LCWWWWWWAGGVPEMNRGCGCCCRRSWVIVVFVGGWEGLWLLLSSELGHCCVCGGVGGGHSGAACDLVLRFLAWGSVKQVVRQSLPNVPLTTLNKNAPMLVSMIQAKVAGASRSPCWCQTLTSSVPCGSSCVWPPCAPGLAPSASPLWGHLLLRCSCHPTTGCD